MISLTEPVERQRFALVSHKQLIETKLVEPRD